MKKSQFEATTLIDGRPGWTEKLRHPINTVELFDDGGICLAALKGQAKVTVVGNEDIGPIYKARINGFPIRVDLSGIVLGRGDSLDLICRDPVVIVPSDQD